MNNASWLGLNNVSARGITMGDANGDGREEIFADYGNYGAGIWEFYWNHTQPTRVITSLTANGLVSGDILGNGKKALVADLPGYGLWYFQNDSSWQWFNGNDPLGFAVGQLN